MFKTVLVANRGEIAVRAIRTLKRLGIRSVAVFSDPDRNSRHVVDADVAIALGGQTAAESYLDIERILRAARDTGAEGIFPGYGFLSESAEFAEACEASGIAFIGPTPLQLREFGLKHRARELAQAAGVSMTPGTNLLSNVDEAREAAARIGYPIMLKSTAGGGGIGLTRCNDEESLIQAFESVRRLGTQFFRDGGVFLERFVDHARHIEVQIIGDGAGHVVALGERDCSLQRRNQKVVEETPAPHLPEKTRLALLDSAVQLGKSVQYRSAGTVEFIYDGARDEFYFLEVNTRLQVEHPVTESVTGLDLIELMLRIASGAPVDWARVAEPPRGASIEVRLYAEDPLKNFQPSPGVLTEVSFPPEARVDGWVSTGTEVSPFYDPMIAKLIVVADDRTSALEKLRDALDRTRLEGIATNLAYLRAIARAPEFADGRVSTGFLNGFSFHPSALEIVEPGSQTSVQDYPGRVGYWNIGVPPSGPMDDWAFRLANRIVGNAEGAAGLECTLQGPTLRFHRDAVIALTGAPCAARVDDTAVEFAKPIEVKRGQVLHLGRVTSGCRTYVAVRGGIDVPEYLGSRSTFALGQFGGHAGRLLRAGDVLPLGEEGATHVPAPTSPPAAAPPELVPSYSSDWDIGVLDGPHGAPDFFTAASMDEFFESSWEVHYNSNRLGVRLVGPKPSWTRTDGGEAGLHPSNIHDCEYAIGSINFTGDSPVILTHDGPSLGGFVCPVTIAKAELWKVGQLRPGDRIRFRRIDYDEARRLEAAQSTALAELGATLEAPRPRAITASNPSVIEHAPPTSARPSVTYRQAGDTYILLEYGDNVLDLGLRMRIHLLMQELERSPIPGVLEISPGVRSVQIRYDARVLSQSSLIEKLRALEDGLGSVEQLKIPTRVVHLPMAFEDSATLAAVDRYRETVRANAPWLPNNVDFIQRINGLSSRDEVREVVFSASYMILGLGDVYLGAPCAVPLDPRHRLLTSKYNPARTFTAEGTVGIGGVYMCIYGMDSPGGYQLVGRTLPIWNKFLKNSQFTVGEPWLLRFFDQVRFYPVTEEELSVKREAFREGRFSIRIEEEEFDYAAYQAFLHKNAASIDAFRTHQKAAFETEVALWKAEEAAHPSATQVTPAPVEEELDGHAVTAGLRGNLWKLLVQVGQKVQVGEVLAIIEAMKMELGVSSTVAGTVKAIRSEPGKPVGPEDVILVLDPAE